MEKKKSSGKAPGTEEIRPEMLKAVMDLFDAVWRCGAASKEWQTRECVPLTGKSLGKFTLRYWR